ncbi:hypothetical protein MOF14_12715 [Bacillus spizizenii]|nr:hypothetical protein [Bacillus spizizenii]
MRNKKLMEKVNDLGTQYLSTREHSKRVMIQIAIIMKAFGVKRDEINKPVKDYEREIILSDDEIRKEFFSELKLLNRVKEKNDLEKIREFKNEVHYFVDAVRFFNTTLADEFEKYVSDNH